MTSYIKRLRRTSLVLAAISAISMCFAMLLAGVQPAFAAEDSAVQQPHHELMVSYFRAWRDTNSDPAANKNQLSDLPPEVDIAVVFPDDIETTQAFWDSLPDQITTLHKRGTRVIRSVDIRVMYQNTFTSPWEKDVLTPMESSVEGYAQRAAEIHDILLNVSGLDGVVINAEANMTAEDITRATGVIKALSAYYGPKAFNGTILAYNSDRSGTEPLFTNVYSVVSYVFSDNYGRGPSGVQRDWESYSDKIKPEQYLPGFSFYEEHGFGWLDTIEPIVSSNAGKYALWEPEGASGLKGGIFGYATDRDGAEFGHDDLVPTTFEWTRTLAGMMNKVRYDGNGATSGIMQTQAGRRDTDVQLRDNWYSRTGYTFTGWNTAADGSGTAYEPGSTITVRWEPVTLYAQWALPVTSVEVIFKDGATEVARQSVEVGKPLPQEALPKDPVKEGHIFEGWYTAEAGGAKVDFTQPVSETMTVFARWRTSGSISPTTPGKPAVPSPTSPVVTAQKPARPALTARPPSLATTGTSISAVVFGGVLLAGLGAALLLVLRRRRM